MMHRNDSPGATFALALSCAAALGLGLMLVLILTASPAMAGETALQSVPFASGLEFPTYVGAPPGDYDRVIVAERRGVIRLVKRGVMQPTPYLDIDARVQDPEHQFTEQGLLGIAYHPDFANNGELFIHYTDLDEDTVISRFRISEDLDTVDPDSEEIVLAIDQPRPNHNGGSIEFGPKDGYLYVALGDGGGPPFDPENRAQDPSLLFGKILRIDVDGAAPYEVPPDNPFVGPGDPLDEIWALGLRNPWRVSFDRLTGDLYMGDVGQVTVEEINFQPAASTGGENYGWRCMEGTQCTGLSGCTCNGPELTLPVYEYIQSPGCAVLGGNVYRGCAVPDLDGTYFFADICTASIFSLRVVGGVATDFRDRTAELTPVGEDWIVSFGEDALGEIYFCTYFTGNVYKIVPVDPSPTECDVIICRKGNVNFGAGPIADVLTVNGSSGTGPDRIIDLAVGEAITVDMDAPPANPGGPAKFALYAFSVFPQPSDVTPVPGSLISTCLATPWTDDRLGTLRWIWNNTNKEQLGTADLPSTPAPSRVVDDPLGVGVEFDLFLQGIIRDSGSINGRGSITNAVSVRVR